MDHIVYLDTKSQELEKLLTREKSMIVRGATGRKLPYGRVQSGDKLRFVQNNGEGLVLASATVSQVFNSEKLSEEKIEGAEHWHAILKAGVNGNGKTLEARRAAVKSDDLVTIIYTSGTTGQPKGVMLSHRNIGSNVLNCQNLLPIKIGHRALSFLPLNHVFERMLAYLYMAEGVSNYYAEDITTIGDNLREIKPQIFTTVPRLLEKVYERIISAGMEQNFFKRMIFF